MQYLLQDLIKLPLEDRLLIIEKLIGSFNETSYKNELHNYENQLLSKIENLNHKPLA